MKAHAVIRFPGLEILADDVRCTHGATVGKLEAEPIFYLKSRGISQKDAERVVVEGFFDPIMQRIPFEGVRENFIRQFWRKWVKTMATKKKSKANVKKKLDRKPKSVKAKKAVKAMVKKQTMKKTAKPAVVAVRPPLPVSISAMKPRPIAKPFARPKTKVKVKPQYTPLTSEERRILRTAQPQFTYMNAPAAEHEFQVGDTVEVFCDHEKNGERVAAGSKASWCKWITNWWPCNSVRMFFSTDGWMVPDRILWYPLMSDQIRDATYAKKGSKKEVPDY